MQAHSIFEQRGMLRQLKETKQKIKLLNQTLKGPAFIHVQNEIKEIAVSDREEHEGNFCATTAENPDMNSDKNLMTGLDDGSLEEQNDTIEGVDFKIQPM